MERNVLHLSIKMSNKYLITTDVDGEIRFLSLTSNLSHTARLESLCSRMLKKRFAGQEISGFFVSPWPLQDPPADDAFLFYPVEPGHQLVSSE